MKTGISILLFMVSFTSIFANHTPNSFSVKEHIITVKSSKIPSKKMSITIYDVNGHSVFTENLQKLNVDRNYNLSSLDQGAYTLEIVNDVNTYRQHFNINTKNIELIGDEEKLFAPYVLTDGNKLDVNMMSLYKPVKIQIRDRDENILHDETYVNATIQKRFDISKLSPGEYVLSINSGGRNFYESIVIK